METEWEKYQVMTAEGKCHFDLLWQCCPQADSSRRRCPTNGLSGLYAARPAGQ